MNLPKNVSKTFSICFLHLFLCTYRRVYLMFSVCVLVWIYTCSWYCMAMKIKLSYNICESMCDLDWDSWKHFFGKTEVWQHPVVISILLWLHWGWSLLSKSTPKGRLFGKLKPSHSICSALKNQSLKCLYEFWEVLGLLSSFLFCWL